MSYDKIENLPNQEFANIRILVDFSEYDGKKDRRLLIPFSYYQYYGLMNQQGEIVLQPKYHRILDSCWNESDMVRVGIYYSYGVNGTTKPYTYLGLKLGLVDSNGDFILEPEYRGIGISTDKKILTLRHMDGQYEVTSVDGKVIVPKGKYSWIDSFDNGIARVNISDNGNKKWGIIDIDGLEVLSLQYSNIWNFYNKDRDWITIEVTDEHGNKRVGQFNLLTYEASI